MHGRLTEKRFNPGLSPSSLPLSTLTYFHGITYFQGNSLEFCCSVKRSTVIKMACFIQCKPQCVMSTPWAQYHRAAETHPHTPPHAPQL